MKTIQIDKEDEARLIEILSQSGLEKYSKRINEAISFLDTPLANIVDSSNFEISYIDHNDIEVKTPLKYFYCTGVIQNWENTRGRESDTLMNGFFYGPDGKMYSSSHYKKFMELKTGKSTLFNSGEKLPTYGLDGRRVYL